MSWSGGLFMGFLWGFCLGFLFSLVISRSIAKERKIKEKSSLIGSTSSDDVSTESKKDRVGLAAIAAEAKGAEAKAGKAAMPFMSVALAKAISAENAIKRHAGLVDRAHPVGRQKPRVPSDIAIAFPMRVAAVVGKGYSLRFVRLGRYRRHGLHVGWACAVIDGDGNKICIESGKTRSDAFFEAFQKAGLRCPS